MDCHGLFFFTDIHDHQRMNLNDFDDALVDLSTIRQALLKKHTGHFSLVASVHKNYLQMVSGTNQPLLGQACILINIRTENSGTLPPTLTPKPAGTDRIHWEYLCHEQSESVYDMREWMGRGVCLCTASLF